MTGTLETLPDQQQAVEGGGLHSAQGTWVEVLPHLHPRFGGMSAAVPQLASRLAETAGYAMDIAAFCSFEETAEVGGCDGVLLTNWPASRFTWLRDAGLRRRFTNMIQHADGVHIHGLWETGTNVAARTARKLGTPYILSAHGMLDPWALSARRLKKALYSALVERANVEGAACLHALTNAEAEDYRRFGSRRPIAVIPNGVEIPHGLGSERFLQRFPALRGKRIILFLGRLHAKKGLELLLSAWVSLSSEFADAVLVIAGPDAEGYQAVLESKAHAEDAQHSIVFTGMLHGEEKWSALAAAHCFVLPSYSEGLSVAALEAMGVGVPVVLTTQCHLPEVAASGAGLVIPAELPALQAALVTMLSHSPEAHVEMGACAGRLVQQRFSWSVVARQMAELYRWVQGGPLPRTVELLRESA